MPRGREDGDEMGNRGVLHVLRHREFAIFWAGQAVSLVGTWMQGFTQGLVVTTLSSSAFALGTVNFAMSLPTLLLMPFGGVAADRFERRRILLVTQWAMLILAAVTGALLTAHRLELWHLYAIALLLGVATAYDLPAYQSFYPQLIEREDLPQAISLNQATFNGARIFGPALAAAIVQLWGTPAAFYANAASFLAVILSLQFIRPRPPAAGHGASSPLQMMREGIAYVRERPVVMALLGLTGISTFCVFPNLAVLMPFYCIRVINVGASGLGILMSISGAASLVGALLMLKVPRARRLVTMAVAAGLLVLALLTLAWARHLWVAVIGVVLVSTGISLSIGIASILIQETVPDALRGRVMSLYTLMFTGVMPFAALVVTGLATSVGMRDELKGAGVVYGTGALALVLYLRKHWHGAVPADAATG